MKNKRLILSCALFIAIASLWAHFYTNKDLKMNPTQTKPEATIITKKSAPQKDAPFPHFVAGRPSLVKKAEIIYGKTPNDVISARKPSSNKKNVKRQNPVDQSFFVKNANIAFALDLFACSESDCPEAKALLATNGFYIVKGVPPKKIDKASPSLVTYNKETNLFGVWEKRVIIELKETVDLQKELAELNFSSIERPQEQLFIAEYNGETNQLDATLAQVKQLTGVKNVRLEITYSKKRTN